MNKDTEHTEHDSCSGHNHDGEKNMQSSKSALFLAFWLNLLFSVVEAVGGVLTNSTAILADAFHDFMDAGAIGLAILLEKISGKKRTQQFSYGFKRFSLLSALGLSIFLLIGSVTMIIAAYKSFITPKEVHSIGMLWLAVLGFAVNGVAFLRIKNSGENHHHHGHSHGGGHNHNSKSIMLHLLEDVLGWIAVLIGALIIHFTGWSWIDGVLAIGIALFIGFNASRNLFSTIKVMLQSVPENVNLNELQSDLQQIDGIVNVHDIHAWSMDGMYNVGSVHVVFDNSIGKSEQEIMNAVIQQMKEHNIDHPTVQIETLGNRCGLEDC